VKNRAEDASVLYFKRAGRIAEMPLTVVLARTNQQGAAVLAVVDRNTVVAAQAIGVVVAAATVAQVRAEIRKRSKAGVKWEGGACGGRCLNL
jgi:hypothetical protein